MHGANMGHKVSILISMKHFEIYANDKNHIAAELQVIHLQCMKNCIFKLRY